MNIFVTTGANFIKIRSHNYVPGPGDILIRFSGQKVKGQCTASGSITIDDSPSSFI